MFSFDQDGEKVSTFSWDVETYGLAKQAHPNPTCPGCGGAVHFSQRRGRLSGVTRYFAAHKHESTSCSWMPESTEHEAAKFEIAKALSKAGWEATPEDRQQNENGVHIPDVDAKRDGRRVVFEVQKSAQSALEGIRRQGIRIDGGAWESWWICGPSVWRQAKHLAALGFPAVQADSRLEYVMTENGDVPIGEWAVWAAESRSTGSWLIATRARQGEVISSSEVDALLAPVDEENPFASEVSTFAGEIRALLRTFSTTDRSWAINRAEEPLALLTRQGAIEESCARCDSSQLIEPPTSEQVNCSPVVSWGQPSSDGSEHVCLPDGVLRPSRPADRERFVSPNPESTAIVRAALIASASGWNVDTSALSAKVGAGSPAEFVATRGDSSVQFRSSRGGALDGATMPNSYLVVQNPVESGERVELAREASEMQRRGMPLIRLDDGDRLVRKDGRLVSILDGVQDILSRASSGSEWRSEWTDAWRMRNSGELYPVASVHQSGAFDKVIGRPTFTNLSEFRIEAKGRIARCERCHDERVMLVFPTLQECCSRCSAKRKVADWKDRRVVALLHEAAGNLGKDPELGSAVPLGGQCGCGATFGFSPIKEPGTKDLSFMLTCVSPELSPSAHPGCVSNPKLLSEALSELPGRKAFDEERRSHRSRSLGAPSIHKAVLRAREIVADMPNPPVRDAIFGDPDERISEYERLRQMSESRFWYDYLKLFIEPIYGNDFCEAWDRSRGQSFDLIHFVANLSPGSDLADHMPWARSLASRAARELRERYDIEF